MAWIRKKGRKHAICWRDPDGRFRSTVAPDTAAKRKDLKREIEDTVRSGRRWEPQDACARPLLLTIAERWLKALRRKGLAQRTSDFYAQRVGKFIEWCTNRRAPDSSSLTRTNLEDWFDELTTHPGRNGTPCKRNSGRKYLESVELMWMWAADHDEEWPGQIPSVKRVTPEVKKTPTPQRIAATWEQAQKSVQVMEGWIRCVGVVAYYTGLRVGQIMRLRWDDLDTESGLLTIRGELGKTESERRGRRIPLSAHFLSELAVWPRVDEWIVPCNRTQREARARDAHRAWEASGAPRVVWDADPWHCFRAAWQSNLLAVDAPFLATEYYMGHKLPGTAESYVDPIRSFKLYDLVKLIPRIDLPDGWASNLTTRRGYQGRRWP